MLSKQFFFTFLFSLSIFFGFAEPLSQKLCDERGNPSEALLDILEYFQVPHDNSWKSIIASTQKKWLRKEGQERWDVDGTNDNSPCVYELFSRIGMTDTIYSENNQYEYALILGATVQRVRARFHFLKEEWKRGVRFNKLIVLTGDRPLHPLIENKDELINPARSPYPFRKDWVFSGRLPLNETEMTKLVFDQLDLPIVWRTMNIEFVDTPQRNGRRPNTKDTFQQWLLTSPTRSQTLIVSDQPFIGRADTIARQQLPLFPISSIGDGFSLELYKKEKIAIPVLLDELARWLYERDKG